MRRRAAALPLAAALLLAGCAPATTSGAAPASSDALSAAPADRQTVLTASDGDLWPSCWSDDGDLYAANGDGKGFGDTASDIAVNRITGTPPHLTGTALAAGDQVGEVWSGTDFTRKPTGMLCLHGDLYLAVQDLRKDFNAAPAATIAVSHDHGRTWSWDHRAPMFRGAFTTVMFVDRGKDPAAAVDGWVYAYGLDGNWRDSFDDSVPDPQRLYLARVPAGRVLERSAWRFWSGHGWSAGIGARRPVLTDTERRYPSTSTGAAGQTVGAANLSEIGQGGVLWDAPLQRYLYTSWTEFTFEFFESESLQGPWRRFASVDYGRYPWTAARYGGYATTIPSKFVADDGRSMWLQSNVCPCANAGVTRYGFDLRRMTLTSR